VIALLAALNTAQVNIPNFGKPTGCVAKNGFFCAGWFSDNWGSIFWPALRDHIILSLVAVVIGAAISFVLAIVAHRAGWVTGPVTFVTGLLYTIPSLALFQILVPLPGLGLSFQTAEIALVSYTLLILFRNFLTGLTEVPDEVREAARGMGLTKRQLLTRVELPLALPAMIAGLRIATVTVISLATIAAFVGINQGLGVPIFQALQRGPFNTELVGGGVMAILLAILADLILVIVQRMLTPWTRAARA
jgi:osmoprotectant transport system permease protein